MIVYPYIVSGRELAEHLPLQQGLRLSWSFTSDTTQGSRRASSITTRIKTRILDLLAS